MKIVRTLLLTVCVLTLSASAWSQKLSTGRITYSMEYLNLSEQMKAMESMLPKQMILGFTAAKVRLDISGGMGGQIVLSDRKTGNQIFILDMMGAQTCYDLTGMKQDDSKDKTPPKVTLTKETKDILGYKCTKALVEIPAKEEGGTPATLTVWFTDQIDFTMPSRPGQPNPFKDIKGMMLEYEIKSGQLTIKNTATKIDKVSPSDEELSKPKDCETRPLAEFEQLMKMQGGR